MAQYKMCNIPEFKLNTEDSWQNYVKRVKAFFAVNDVKLDLQTSYLIALVGNETYELINNLCSPEEPESKSFEELVVLVQNHLSPKSSEIAERIKFRTCKQRSSESLSEYLINLKKLAKSCNFKGKDHLEENLRDQFVYGINDEKIRQRLLSDRKLTYERALNLSFALEAAEKEAKLGDAWTARGSFDTEVASSAGGAVLAVRGGSRARLSRVMGARSAVGASSASVNRSFKRCFRCGSKQHSPDVCNFIKAKCFKCDKVGHISHMCKKLSNMYCVNNSDSESDEVVSTPTLYTLNESILGPDNPWYYKVNIDGYYLNMLVDTGSSISAISKKMFNNIFNNKSIFPTNKILTVYSGQKIKPVGKMFVNIANKSDCFQAELFVIDNGNCPPILGRQWMSKLGISMPFVCNINMNKSDDILLKIAQKFNNVFKPGMGTFNKFKIKLSLVEGAEPVWRKARVVPYALRPAVDAEIDRLVNEGVLSPAEDVGGWGTPIVPVVKHSGGIRICCDFKVTLNPVLCDDKYPLPRIEDLFASLRGGKTFSKIDLKSAYTQLLLDDDSRKLCTIVTHKGNFIYNRLPFGIKTAPNKFQRIMDSLFKLPHVGVFIDDLIVTGVDEKSHIQNLYKVFEILNNCGLRIAKEKCCFFQDKVSYLGHVINAEGLHTEAKKIDAVLAAARPASVSELRAFLGLVNYYSKFVKNFSSIVSSLYRLLHKDSVWFWSDECEAAFINIKEHLKNARVLMHYDPELPVFVACDASSVGVGAWLGHVLPNGERRAVLHASRTLSSSEQNYSQICREGLAIIFGIKKFHEYIYGRHFTLISDCKPLCSIFGPKTSIPLMIAGRLQRWAIILSAYNYDVKCIKSGENCLADALSRSAANSVVAFNDVAFEEEKELSYFIEANCPVTFEQIAKASTKDVLLNKVVGFVHHGWPNKIDNSPELREYFNRKDFITIEHGCLLFGYRVIVPNSLRSLILNQLHNSHMGIVKTKSLARLYVYWPNIDKDLENMCNSCEVCLKERRNPPKSTLSPWPWPEKPWFRVHMDFLGPFCRQYFLVLIDATTKWIEACPIKSTEAQGTVNTLREIFARFGLPHEIVTDNGPPFSSRIFYEFMHKNGIVHIHAPPRHPQSNGAAENAVGQIKRCLRKSLTDGIPINIALNRFLLNYRNAEHCTTKRSPSEMLFGRKLRSCMDILVPSTSKIVNKEQEHQIERFNGKLRSISIGDTVMFKKWCNNKEIWMRGSVLDKLSKNMYIVEHDGEKHHRHIDQMFVAPRRSGVEAAEVDVGDSIEGMHEDSVTNNESSASRVCPSETSSELVGKRITRRPVRYGFDEYTHHLC